MEIQIIDERTIGIDEEYKKAVKRCPLHHVKMPRTMKQIGYDGAFKHLIRRALENREIQKAEEADKISPNSCVISSTIRSKYGPSAPLDGE